MAKPRPSDMKRPITGRIRAQSEEQARTRSTSPFFGTGMHPNGEGGIDSDNYVAGVSGYRFDDDGNAEFNDLTLRGGIIGNDALAQPVLPSSAYDYTTNFALTTTAVNIRTKNIAVPAGFTTAAVALTVRVYAINNSAGLDYLFSQANINGYNGLALPVPATNGNGSAMNVSTFSTVLTGAALGSTLTLQIAAWTGFGGWSANASNSADLSASIAWYR